MAELINLRRVRKRKARIESDGIARANRLKHGVPKREREVAKAEKERLRRVADSKKLDSGD